MVVLCHSFLTTMGGYLIPFSSVRPSTLYSPVLFLNQKTPACFPAALSSPSVLIHPWVSHHPLCLCNQSVLTQVLSLPQSYIQ